MEEKYKKGDVLSDCHGTQYLIEVALEYKRELWATYNHIEGGEWAKSEVCISFGIADCLEKEESDESLSHNSELEAVYAVIKKEDVMKKEESE
jgi:hypothetical protein